MYGEEGRASFSAFAMPQAYRRRLQDYTMREAAREEEGMQALQEQLAMAVAAEGERIERRLLQQMYEYHDQMERLETRQYERELRLREQMANNAAELRMLAVQVGELAAEAQGRTRSTPPPRSDGEEYGEWEYSTGGGRSTSAGRPPTKKVMAERDAAEASDEEEHHKKSSRKAPGSVSGLSCTTMTSEDECDFKQFKTSDTAQLRPEATLEPGKVRPFLEGFLEQAEMIEERAALILDEVNLDARDAPRVPGSLRSADRWLARQLRACLDPKAKYVKWLLSQLRATEEGKTALRSGAMLAYEMMKMHRAKAGPDAEEAIAKFRNKKYLQPGMAKVDALLAIQQLIVDYNELPAGAVLEANLQTAIIKKMPEACKTQKEQLLDRMIKRQAQGKAQYTVQELTELVASYAARAAGEGSTDLEASVGEQKAEKCTMCGQTHLGGWRGCKCGPCETCRYKFCPAAAKRVRCPSTWAARPAKGQIKNALEKPIKDWMVEKLAEKWDKRNPAAQASAASAATEKQKQATEPQSSVSEMSGDAEDGLFFFGNVETSTAETDDRCEEHLLGIELDKIQCAMTEVEAGDEARESSCMHFLAASPAVAGDDGLMTTMGQIPEVNSAQSGDSVQIQVDGGSNCCLTTDRSVAQIGDVLSAEPRSLKGVCAGVDGTIEAVVRVGLQMPAQDGETVTVGIVTGVTPKARRDVLSESVIWDLWRGRVLKEPEMCIKVQTTAGERRVQLVRRNGLYFIEGARYVKPSEDGECSMVDVQVHEASAAKRRLSEKQIGQQATAVLLAARLNITAQTMRTMSQCEPEFPIKALTQKNARLIDSDCFRGLGNSKLEPATRGHRTMYEPHITVFEGDVYGPAHVADPIYGWRFHIQFVCCMNAAANGKERTEAEVKGSGFPYDFATKNHTENVMFDAIARVAAQERLLGHETILITLDQGSEMTSGGKLTESHLQAQCAAIGVAIRFASRERSESLGTIGNHQMRCGRGADIMLMRAQKGEGYHIRARVYSSELIKLTPPRGQHASTFTLHTGRTTPLEDPPPLVFGTTVVVHNRKPDHKGPHQRAQMGWISGMVDKKYQIIKPNNTDMYQREGVKPMNERGLAESGLPAHVGKVDKAVGTEAAVNGTPAVEAPVEQVTQRDKHFPEETQVERDQPETDLVGPPSVRVKQRKRGQRMAEALHACMQRVHASDAVSVFNGLLHTMDSGAEECFEVECDAQIADAIARLASAGTERCAATAEVMHVEAEASGKSCWADADSEDELPPVGTLRRAWECSKAEREAEKINTEYGMASYHIPATDKERDAAPDRTEWEAADNLAVDVLLYAGNEMIRISEVPKGAFIADSVMARKIKKDAQGFLKKRKSRLSLDGKRLRRMQVAMRGKCEYDDRRAWHVSTVDDITFKLFSGDAAHNDLDVTALDVGNAYAYAERQRAVGYMRLQKCVRRYAPDGEELVMLVNTPVYGEDPAGEEWDMDSDAVLETTGLERAEGVPACWMLRLECGGMFKVLKTVDDFMCSEPRKYERAHAKKLREALLQIAPEVSYEEEPKKWCGYGITRDRARRVLTLRMTEKLKEAAARHLPEGWEANRPSKNLAKGESLPSLCRGLQPIAADQKVDQELQTLVQKVLGDLRYPERVTPAITLPLHSLACVAVRPPPEARRVAELLLEQAYDERTRGITLGGRECPYVDLYMNASEGMGAMKLSTLPGGAADSTWMASPELYALVVYAFGAAVHHCTKKHRLVCSSSFIAEGAATNELLKMVLYARNAMRAWGYGTLQPSVLWSDSLSNVSVSNNAGAAAKCKHELCRYLVLQQRVKAGDVFTRHIVDPMNFADFLTKWVSGKKIETSLKLITNCSNAA